MYMQNIVCTDQMISKHQDLTNSFNLKNTHRGHSMTISVCDWGDSLNMQ